MTIDELLSTWATRPVGALIDHIIARYHAPLGDQLSEVALLSAALDQDHWGAVITAVRSFRVEIIGHMEKEERITFPMVRSDGGFMGVPLQVMEHEHDLAQTLITAIRKLTGGYRAPADAPRELRRLFELLETIERDLDEHTALENLLFERARLARTPL